MIENGTSHNCQLCVLCCAAEQELSGSPSFKRHLHPCRTPATEDTPDQDTMFFEQSERGDVRRPQRSEDFKEVAQGSVPAESAATTPAAAASPFGANHAPSTEAKLLEDPLMDTTGLLPQAPRALP